MCRSATYYAGFGLCKLSEESRRSAPASFRPAQRGTTYLENECAVRKCENICRWRKYLLGLCCSAGQLRVYRHAG